MAWMARNPVAAGRFIDFLLSRPGQELIAGPASLYALRTDIHGEATAKTLQETSNGPLIPIRLGPGLLVYLDRLIKIKICPFIIPQFLMQIAERYKVLFGQVIPDADYFTLRYFGLAVCGRDDDPVGILLDDYALDPAFIFQVYRVAEELARANK